MFPIFEPPILITLIMLFYFLFFFILFLSKLHEPNEKNQKASKDQREFAEKRNSECTMFGFLEKLPKGDSIPGECMTCQKLVECLLKKKAFEWYSGESSPKKSEP